MPETGRLLQFPQRRYGTVSPEEAGELARRVFASGELRRDELSEGILANADFLNAACKQLLLMIDVSPESVAHHGLALYESLTEANTVGLFDERDYFLGETARLVGTSLRHLGRSTEAETWLDRAEASFRHTLNPGPALANVSYARLALKYEMRRFNEVVDLVPSLSRSFERLGMVLEAAKCRFLLAASLKQLGRYEEAFSLVSSLEAEAAVKQEPAIFGQVLIEIGEHLAGKDDFAAAISKFQQALPLLRSANRPMALAYLKVVLGETFRRQGNLVAALGSFKEALLDWKALGMATYVAYLHVLIAENLLALNRAREAEWEIQAALPTIDREKLAPEGIAAVVLLQESVRQRKTDPKALQEVREHLQKLA